MRNNQQGTKSLYNIFYDICIIGGGASGMAAAISATEENPTLQVCIVEKMETLGKKLLATGNGKCNITNSACSELEVVSDFLKNSGVMIKEEAEGRMYPYSEQALAVFELLKSKIKSSNVTVFTKCEVLSINENECHGFDVNINCVKEKVFIPCSKVVLACGGKAAPQFGTTGEGYAIAKSFGHEVTKLYPVLMPIECEGIEKELKGVRAKGKVSLLKNEEIIAVEKGELQFTEDGLSGICIFNLSRYITLEDSKELGLENAFRQYTIEVDFLPEMEEYEVMDFLEERRDNMASVSTEVYLASIINIKMAEALVEQILGEERGNIGNISYEELEEIAMALKSSRYTVIGAKGWKEAQCTGGGISLDEIDPITMESKIQKGLYCVGELLDYDGPCGGFNLHNAWITGIKAGTESAKSLKMNAMIGE